MKQPANYRDLSFLPLSAKQMLVIACDSSAGIGQKSADAIAVDPALTAACCLRVPLMELFCFGADPMCVIDLIGNEYETTGKRMLQGIQQELKNAGLAELPINGSTEENMLTKMTSIGITVIGQSAVQPTPIVENCSLLQLGQPYVGQEVVKHLQHIFSYQQVKDLKQEIGVVDMLPVGSKGIRYEAELMARQSNCQITFFRKEKLSCSAGPATVVLLAVKKTHENSILSRHPNLIKIGEFQKR